MAVQLEAAMTVDSPRKFVAVTCLALLFLAVGLPSARAQAIHQGKLTGTVAGEDRAVIPGVTVEISSPALIGGTRSTTTTGNGSYVFHNLPVGRYKVTASLAGFKTSVRENIDVSPDATVNVDITLPVGGIEETVTVSAEAPVVDTRTATTDSKIDQEMLTKLPTSRDAFYDLSLTTPGMFLINGVNATNPRAGAFGTLVNVNYDAVEEVRIVALGSKAEYGSYSGAALDVLTKSGSNVFHGTGAIYSLIGDPASNQPSPGEDLGASFLYVGEGEQLSGETKSDWEASGTLGGPIMKDKLWFFGAFDYLRSSSLPPRWSLQNESWNRYADAKVSWAPVKNHLIWGSYHYENNDGNGWSWGSEPGWDTSMTYGQVSKNHSASAQWQWFPTRRAPPARNSSDSGRTSCRTFPLTIPPIPATSTGGSGPSTASTARSPISRPTSRTARRSRPTSRSMPRASSVSTTSSSGFSTRRGGAIRREATSRTT
jgi:hypothetical protein